VKLAEALSIVRSAPVNGTTFHVVLACGFTPLHLQNYLAAYLQRAMPDRRVHIETGLFEDAIGTLTNFRNSQAQAGVLVLEWADLDSRLGYRHLGGWGQRVVPSILANVQTKLKQFESIIRETSSASKLAISLPTLPLPPGFHTSCWQATEAELALREAVLSFARSISAHPSVLVVNEQNLNSFSPFHTRYDFRSDLNTGFPYTLTHAEALGQGLAALVKASEPKKGLITDLDDTLWLGLVGEIGHEQVAWDLASHGQLHGLYQQMLRLLAEQGVLIAVASKNSPEIAAQALSRADLILHKDQIFPIEVHWEAKSSSVARILRAWNIGADSVVFIDDSPMELAEVQAAYPAMECILFPKSDLPAGFALLQRLRDLFGKPRLSEEDTYRLQSIRQGQQFAESQDSSSSLEDLLASAEATISLEYNPPASDKRIVELVNKTNQFNLNGRRFTEAEWQEELQNSGAFALAISYQDKFGPLGKIAVISGRHNADTLMIEAWVMSCRAFSRRIEHQTIARLFERFGAKDMVFNFAPTAKNKPLTDFLKELTGEEPERGIRFTREMFTAKCPKLYHSVIENNG
jgi:FkbH-like protein